MRDPSLKERLSRCVFPGIPKARGTTLYHAGAPRAALYILRSGTAKAVVVDVYGNACVTAFYFPGDLIGVTSIGSHVNQESIVLLERCMVCEISFPAIEQESRSEPRIGQALLRMFGSSMAIERDARLRTARMSVDGRIADFLLDISHRLGRLGRRDDFFVLSMSRYDIASHLGVANESVSRAFGRLSANGLIEVHGKQIELKSVDGLEQCACGTQMHEDRSRHSACSTLQ